LAFLKSASLFPRCISKGHLAAPLRQPTGISLMQMEDETKRNAASALIPEFPARLGT
jgi:hypothetical protein